MIVVGLLATHVCALLFAVQLASAGGGHAVVPDYYQKAVHWDDARAESRASAALGWTVTVTPSVLTNGDGTRALRFLFLDENGQPVEGAQVTARVWHHALGTPHEFTVPATAEPGLYIANPPIARPGAWECEYIAQRGEERFVQNVTLSVVAPLESGADGR